MILEQIKNLKNGRFFRIQYKTDVALSAAMKNKGYKVVKLVTKTVRTGVNYENMASTKPREERQNHTTNNYEPIIVNKLYPNSKTGLDYLRVATVKKGNARITYHITTPEGEYDSDSFDKEWLIPSKRGSFEAPPVQNIKLENIIKIGA